MLEATRKLNDSILEPEAEETPEGVASSAAGVDESSSKPTAASASAATESQGGGYLLSAGPSSWRMHLGYYRCSWHELCLRVPTDPTGRHSELKLDLKPMASMEDAMVVWRMRHRISMPIHT